MPSVYSGLWTRISNGGAARRSVAGRIRKIAAERRLVDAAEAAMALPDRTGSVAVGRQPAWQFLAAENIARKILPVFRDDCTSPLASISASASVRAEQ